ncbi:D-inositol-3-phosphate glycosyltransferase [compost metagenome]
MTRVLFLTHEVIGRKMAGPAIRCCELARQLVGHCEVTVATPMPIDEAFEAPFRVVSFDDDPIRLRSLAEAADVIVLQGLMHRRYPLLTKLGKFLVADLYDPFIFESYPGFLAQPDGGATDYLHFWDVMNEQMELADFSICASDRQRDMWIGRYCALGRLTPALFERDPSFRSLIDVIPFGVSDTPPRHEKRVLKGVVPGISETDKVLLWGGGIWNWFDPLTVIRAVARLAETRQDIKLYFLGVKPPNPEIPEMEMATEAVRLAEALGVKDRFVFFNHGWVPYDERQNYLLEADVGISSHFDSIETRFSFRTRVLDYLWAGLPLITTEGDAMAELTRARELGIVTRFESVDDWAAAISRLVDDPAQAERARANVRAQAEAFRWSTVAVPLRRYCEAPAHAPRALWSVSKHYRPWDDPSSLVGLGAKALRVLKTGGPQLLLAKGRRFLAKHLPASSSSSSRKAPLP